MSPLADREQRLAYGRAYRQTHKAETAVRNAAWYQEHKEEQSRYRQAYYKEHKAEIIEQHRVYCQTHKAQIFAMEKAYREKRGSERLASKKMYYEGHKAEVMAHNRLWMSSHPDEVREQRKRARARRTQQLGSVVCDLTAVQWRVIKESQGHKCAMCSQVKPLERDHIIPLSRGGAHITSNIQGLCRHCNASKNNRLISEMAGVDVAVVMAGREPAVLFEGR